MSASDRDLLLLHAWFLVVAAVALLAPLPFEAPVLVLALVVLYNVAVPVAAIARSRREWLGTWAFLLLISVFQVLPDRFLAEVLGVLTFATAGVPSWGAVPVAMAGMWVIPLMLIVIVGRASSRRGQAWATANVAAASLVIFGLAEHLLPLVPVWRPLGVDTIGNAAVYILPAEVVLGVAAFRAVRYIEGQPWLVRIPTAAAVTVLYVGAATTSWLLLERGL